MFAGFVCRTPAPNDNQSSNQLSKQVLSHLGKLHSHPIPDGLSACIIGCQADCQQACGVHSARLEQLCCCGWICVAARKPAHRGQAHRIRKSCKDLAQMHKSEDTICGKEQTGSTAHVRLSSLLLHASPYTWAGVPARYALGQESIPACRSWRGRPLMEPGQEVLLSQRELGLPGAGALVGQKEAHGGHRLLQARLLAAVCASQGLRVPPPAPGLPACHYRCSVRLRLTSLLYKRSLVIPSRF